MASPMTQEEFNKLPREEQNALLLEQKREYREASPEKQEQMLASIADLEKRKKQKEFLEQEDPAPAASAPATTKQDSFFAQRRSVAPNNIGMRLADFKTQDAALVFAALAFALAGPEAQKNAAIKALKEVIANLDDDSELKKDFAAKKAEELSDLLKLWLVNKVSIQALTKAANNSKFKETLHLLTEADEEPKDKNKLAFCLHEKDDAYFVIFSEAMWQALMPLDPGETKFDYARLPSAGKAADFSFASVFEADQSENIRKALRTQFAEDGSGKRNQEIKAVENWGAGFRVEYTDGASVVISQHTSERVKFSYQAKELDETQAHARIAQLMAIVHSEAAFLQQVDPESQAHVSLESSDLAKTAPSFTQHFKKVVLQQKEITQTFVASTSQKTAVSSAVEKFLKEKETRRSFNEQLEEQLPSLPAEQADLVKRYLGEPQAVLSAKMPTPMQMPDQQRAAPVPAPEAVELKQLITAAQADTGVSVQKRDEFVESLGRFFSAHPQINKQQISQVASFLVALRTVYNLQIVPNFGLPIPKFLTDFAFTSGIYFGGTRLVQRFSEPQPKADYFAPLTFTDCAWRAASMPLMSVITYFIPGPEMLGRVIAGVGPALWPQIKQNIVQPYAPYLWQMAKYSDKTSGIANRGLDIYKSGVEAYDHIRRHPRTRQLVTKAEQVQEKSLVLIESGQQWAQSHPQPAQAISALLLMFTAYAAFDTSELLNANFMWAFAAMLGWGYKAMTSSEQATPTPTLKN